MMRPRVCLFAVAAALLTAWPTSAYAASDIIGWFGELSGPGPWKVNFTGVESRLWCASTDAAARDTMKQKIWNCLLDDPDKTRAVLSYQLTWAGTGVTQLFKDDPTDVREAREFTFSLAYMYRANSVLEVGAGISFMHFYTGDVPSSTTNPDFGFSRTGLIPARVTLTPLGAVGGSARARALYRLVHLQIENTWIPGGFTGADFHNAKTAYNVDAEFQTRVQLLLDGAAVIRAARSR